MKEGEGRRKEEKRERKGVVRVGEGGSGESGSSTPSLIL